MREYKQIILRVPAELREWLRASAEANKRSMQAELLHRIERSREQDQRRSAA